MAAGLASSAVAADRSLLGLGLNLNLNVLGIKAGANANANVGGSGINANANVTSNLANTNLGVGANVGANGINANVNVNSSLLNANVGLTTNNGLGVNLGLGVTPQMVQLLCGTAAIGGATLASSEAVNSVFLTQSTAFVGAPANPRPDSQGGGVWVRGVGGEVQYNGGSILSSSGASVPGGAVGCPSGFRQNFGGFQAGQDLAKLDFMGWNIHAGQTAGYVGGNGNSTGGSSAGFSASSQMPFVGAYVAATNGGFFADALVRMNWYDNSIDSPGSGLSDQKLDAHGVSVSGSFGYHWTVPNSAWFIEPSIAGIWSRTTIDPFNVVAAGSAVDGVILFNPIDSFIGRAGVRVGTTLQTGNVIYQPFVAVSAWHEFEGNLQAGFTNSAFATVSIPGIGTYGQYSLGANAQMANSGWLGYARVDYRNGDRIEGWSGTGGLRYQFSPDPEPVTGMYKAPVKAVGWDRAADWTGFYAGVFAGADYGDSKMAFPGVGDAGPQIAGALAGGTLGYNYQIGSWVVGVEGDAGWTNARGSVACGGAFSAPGVLAGTDCADRADFLATAAARLGYAWGRTLYYVKAGGAWTHETFSMICNNNFGIPCTGPSGRPLTQTSASDDRLGWTIGYGAEFALTQKWSAKAEVNYIDFGNRNMTASDGTLINAGMRITEGKVGVNYRF